MLCHIISWNFMSRHVVCHDYRSIPTTDWVNSPVVVEKSSGSLRLCLDPKDLNKAIKREHYKIPTIQEISSELAGKSVFSKLDLKDGYWQIELDTESFCCALLWPPSEDIDSPECPLEYLLLTKFFKRIMKRCLRVYQVSTLLLTISL